MDFLKLCNVTIRMRIGIALLMSSLLLSACVTRRPNLPKLAPDAGRLSIDGASFMPPSDGNWYIPLHARYHIGLVTPLKNEDETVAIEAQDYRIRDLIPPDQFVQQIKEGEKNTNPARFTTKLHEVTAATLGQATCARSHFELLDNAPHVASGSHKPMILEAFSLKCIEPDNPHLGISVTYSARYYPGDRNPDLTAKANQVLESVELTPSIPK